MAVKTRVQGRPLPQPEEFKRRLREPGISLEELDKMLERELKALATA